MATSERNGTWSRNWQIFVFAVTLALAGFGAWSSTRSDIAVLKAEVTAHETSQAASEAKRDRQLERIEDRLNQVLAAVKRD